MQQNSSEEAARDAHDVKRDKIILNKENDLQDRSNGKEMDKTLETNIRGSKRPRTEYVQLDTESETGNAATTKRQGKVVRRETISPIRITSEFHGRRDTLSPNGLLRLESLVRDSPVKEPKSPSFQVDTHDGRDHTSSVSNSSSTVLPAISSPISTKSIPVVTDESERRSTLDPKQVADILQLNSNETNDPINRRSTLDPSEALSLLSEIENGSQVDGFFRSQSNDEQNDTIDGADLKKMTAGNDSSDEDEVLIAFDKPHDDFQVGEYSILDSSRKVPLSKGNDSPPSNETSLEDVSRRKSPRLQSHTIPSMIHDTLLSPPLRRKQPTPLKSCLSGRKPKKMTTPTKSVVFGSPRGAEFRMNDPSTSMTPMCDRQAKKMFPLDTIDSEEDEVTSENTSILEEADHLLDENDSMTFPFGSVRSPNRSKRNSAVKGVSPLDNIADARRKRRSSFGIKPDKPSRRQSLLGVNVMQNSNSFVAGSAKKSSPKKLIQHDSSSDEDMELTGEYTNLVSKSRPAVELSNGLGDLWSEQYTPQETIENENESSEDDQTLDLGPIGALKGDASVFGRGGNGSKPISNESPSFSGLKPLQPIIEEEETSSKRSSNLSELNLSSSEEDDDDDDDYEAKRGSVVINLGSKFEKIGSASKKKLQNEENDQFNSISSTNLDEIPDLSMPSTQNTPEKSIELNIIQDISFENFYFKFNINNNGEKDIINYVSECGKLYSNVLFHPHLDHWISRKLELEKWLNEINLDLILLKNIPRYLTRLDYMNQLPSKEIFQLIYSSQINNVIGNWYLWRNKNEKINEWNEINRIVLHDLNEIKKKKIGRKEKQENQVAIQLLNKEIEYERCLDLIQEQEIIRSEYSTRIKNMELKNQILLNEYIQNQREIQLHQDKFQSTMIISDKLLQNCIENTQEKSDFFQILSRFSLWKCQFLSKELMEFHFIFKSMNTLNTLKMNIKINSEIPIIHFNILTNLLNENLIFSEISNLICTILINPLKMEKNAFQFVRSIHDFPLFFQNIEMELSRSIRLWKEIEELILKYYITIDTTTKILWITFISFKNLLKFKIGLFLSNQFYFTILKPNIQIEYGNTKIQTNELIRRIQNVKKGFHRMKMICNCVETYLNSLNEM